MSRRFYVALVPSILMLGSETLVTMLCILSKMGSLHNQAARQISGKIHQRMQKGVWSDPPIGEALADACMETIGVYITCRQNTAAQYIATQPIFGIIMAEEQRPARQCCCTGGSRQGFGLGMGDRWRRRGTRWS